jgi:uncharacterized delta-60 repeat protein
MTRLLLAFIVLLALPVAAQARPGDPDRRFGRQGTVTLRATEADAVGGAVKVISGNRTLAGGSAGGQFVVVRLRPSGSLDSRFGTGGQVVPALPGTSLDGVRAISTFRDGRIVAAGTLRLADGSTRFAAFRLLPTGEIDPSFGQGFGYKLVGPPGGELDTMTMDRNGNVILAGGRPNGPGAEVPVVVRLLPDGNADPGFASAGVLDGSAIGVNGGRATGLLLRSDGTITFTVGAGPTTGYPATFTTVRVLSTGGLDVRWGGTGIVSHNLAPNNAAGIGASDIAAGPSGTTIVAGTDLTNAQTPRGAVLRMRADGTLDTRFGTRGITRISRAGQQIRIKAMARDTQGRILLVGSGAPPESMVMRLRGNGARDNTFGNRGLTFPLLGRPPGGEPIYTTFEAIDNMGSRAVIAGSAAGPGVFQRSATSTTYTGRFALTVSKLQ